MANPFTLFPFNAAGTPGLRTMPERLAEVKNVRDFGAVGDNSHDDTANIQAAVDVGASTGLHGTIYFPPGTYKVTAPITFNHVGDTSIRFMGEGLASLITGSVAGFIFDRSANPAPGTLAVGPIVFEYMAITNHYTGGTYGGGCIRVGSTICVHVRNCNLSAQQRVWFCGETFDASEACLIENCPMGGSAAKSLLANAVVLGGTGSVQACDITGNPGCAVRIFGKGASVRDTRMEVNRTAILVGKFPDNTDDTSCGNFTWIGSSTESNGLTLDLQNCANFFCAATGPGGGSAPYRGPAISGVTVLTGPSGTVTTDSSGINVFGQFTAASKTGTINGLDRLTNAGAGVPTGCIAGEAITSTPLATFVYQNPEHNLYVGPNVRNGVFAGMGSGTESWAESSYISDTTNRAGIVFIGCACSTSATALGTTWRIPTTAHTAEFINCIASVAGSPAALPAPVYLFSGLPTGGNVREGDEYDISNAHTATGAWGETVSASGGVTVGNARVRYNGTNWTLVGK